MRIHRWSGSCISAVQTKWSLRKFSGSFGYFRPLCGVNFDLLESIVNGSWFFYIDFPKLSSNCLESSPLPQLSNLSMNISLFYICHVLFHNSCLSTVKNFRSCHLLPFKRFAEVCRGNVVMFEYLSWIRSFSNSQILSIHLLILPLSIPIYFNLPCLNWTPLRISIRILKRISAKYVLV